MDNTEILTHTELRENGHKRKEIFLLVLNFPF